MRHQREPLAEVEAELLRIKKEKTEKTETTNQGVSSTSILTEKVYSEASLDIARQYMRDEERNTPNQRRAGRGVIVGGRGVEGRSPPEIFSGDPNLQCHHETRDE